MLNDLISDLLTRIRNAIIVKSEFVLVLFTKVICSILEILKAEKFIKKFLLIKIKFTYFILIVLSYNLNKKCFILKQLKRISKSSLQLFATKNKKLTKIYVKSNIVFLCIISTSYGIMTNHTAKNLQIGGEILFQLELVNF
jgi:small subunit ribosomal protein S8